jgi:S1-C subfamily serine protease
MDRIHAVYEDLPEAAELFAPGPRRSRAKASRSLERVFRYMAGRAGPSVVSLEVQRKQPLDVKAPGMRGGLGDLPRYLGPSSGVLLDAEGWVVTSLYNLTNTLELIAPGAKLPPPSKLETGLQAVEKVTVHLPEGAEAEAKLVAHHGGLGIALLKAEMPAATGTAAPRRGLEAAPADAFEVGRFVLALGNPFGAEGNADPLLTMGVLSKHHAFDAPHAWRGQWQTDAGVTDGNCGGAVVDLEGRLLGVIQIWNPTGHGRNSGIGFVVPWPEIERALPDLKQGRSPKRGFLGVHWRQGATIPTITKVAPDTPAAAAGLQAGDRIVAVDGRDTETVRAVHGALVYRWQDETLELTVERDGKRFDVEVTLAARP